MKYLGLVRHISSVYRTIHRLNIHKFIDVRDKNDVLLKKLGSRIKSERLRKGLSAERLAYEMGISKGNLSEIERGMRDVRVSTLSLIAEGLEMSLSKLLKDL